MKITKVAQSKIGEVDFDNLSFGEVFSDHMFSVDFEHGRWQTPEIVPYGPIEVYPALATLHYGQAIFEGLKAFATESGSVQVFRPHKYHERMNRSCRRLCIPEVDLEVFLSGITELVALDRAWVPGKRGYALYIRPFIFASEGHIGLRVSESYRFMIIASPVGAYYKEGINPVRLITSGEYVRAVRGGVGAAKTPANYAASLLPAEEAKKKGFTQVLWLDAVEHRYVEEVGTMNMFFLVGDELVTAPLEGTILAGVTRDSVIHIAKDWGLKVSERQISIDEVMAAAQSGALKEAFGTGTAAVISPVAAIQHQETLITIGDGKTGKLSRELYDEITALQYGEKPDRFGWCLPV
jgi:branched-chain amino acid aminotransferase